MDNGIELDTYRPGFFAVFSCPFFIHGNNLGIQLSM
jgi:hypothetical protein